MAEETLPNVSLTEQNVGEEPQKKKKPYGFIALDIETTGANVFTDKMFAVGWAYGSCKEDVVTGKCVLDLKKPFDKSWSFFWNQNRWESRCWTEFWSKPENEPILDALQNEQAIRAQPRAAWCENDNAVAYWVCKALHDVEEAFEKYTVVTDTIAFDTVWLTNLLCGHEFPGLGYRRDGTFNRGIGGIEVDSYLMGAYGLKLNCRDARNGLKIRKLWSEDPDYADAIKDAPPHDHDPENDAHNILHQLFCAAGAAGRFEHLIDNFICERKIEKEVGERAEKSREACRLAKRILDSSPDVADHIDRVLERGGRRGEGRWGRGGERSPTRRREERTITLEALNPSSYRIEKLEEGRDVPLKRSREEEEEEKAATERESSPPKKMKTRSDSRALEKTEKIEAK